MVTLYQKGNGCQENLLAKYLTKKCESGYSNTRKNESKSWFNQWASVFVQRMIPHNFIPMNSWHIHLDEIKIRRLNGIGEKEGWGDPQNDKQSKVDERDLRNANL